MNYNKLKAFRFWETADAALASPRFEGRRRTSLYPSEASVIATDPRTGEKSVLGGCHTKSWYRLRGVKKTNPPGIKGLYIFEFGKYVEKMIIELSKKGFVYENSNAKFWDPQTAVSGEIDIVVKHPEGGMIFIEVKSTYGYYKEKEIMGNKSQKGAPQDAHLLQIGTYLWFHREDLNLVGGKLVYLLRDNMSRAEFDITIVDEGEKHRLQVDGVTDLRFYVEDIFSRYQILMDTVKASTQEENPVPPPRDFQLVFTDEEIEARYLKRDISKSAYEAWQKNHSERPGEWQCGYCDWKDHCWKQADIDAHLGLANQTAVRPKKRVAPNKAA